MDPRIFGILQQVGAAADDAARAQLRADSNEELARHFRRHPNELEEVAYDLLNIAWADSLTSDILQRIIEVKTIGLTDVDYIEDDLRGMTAYWQGKGGIIRSGILRAERERMPTEELVAAIDMHQDDFRTEFWGPFDKLAAHAEEKMRILPVERLVELVQAAIGGGTTFGTFASATLTSAQVDSVVDEVALRANGQVSIVGSLVAVRKLSKVGLEFGDNLKEQIFKTGVVGVYKGYQVVQVENFENFLGEFVLPHNELWIVGRNAGRLTYYGDDAKVQQLRMPSFYFRWETARDAGMLLYGAGRPDQGGKGRVGRIVLT